MTNEPFYVLTYERVSTDDQAKTQSCNDQKSVNDRYAESQGWIVAEQGDYRDEGISGTLLAERDGLQDLLLRCQKDKTIKAVIVSESDRLARGNLAYIPIREALKRCGVRVVAVTQPMLDDSEEGELIGEVFGAINGFFSKISRRKSMRAADEKAKRGWYPSKAPIGYKNVNVGTEDKPERIIVVDEEKAPYIQQIPKLYNQGYSYNEIADRLYPLGLRGNKGETKVPDNEIRAIIFNDFYLGEFIWRGKKYTGKHPPIFNRFEIQKARARSQEKWHVHSTPGLQNKFLFKKLPFFCATDKTHITAHIRKKYYKGTSREAIYEYYHCTKSKGGWQACKQPCINKEDLIDEFTKKAVFPVEIGEDLAEFLFEEMVKDSEGNQQQQKELLHRINIRLGQIDAELKNLFEMRIAGKIETFDGKTQDEVYEDYKFKKQLERKKLLKQKQQIEENNKDWKQKASNFFSDCCDATNKFVKAAEEKQYRFLRRITSNVVLDEKKLVVSHQFPFSLLLKLNGHAVVGPQASALRTFLMETDEMYEPIFT
jgi:DNA invertase Pin-like site-specific DNA recombinase